MERKQTNWFVTILLFIGSLLILFPVYLTVSIAMKTPEETADSILAIPNTFNIENFQIAIEMTNFFQAFQNSAVITVIVVALTLMSNSLVAYAISRNMHLRIYKFLYFYFISAMFIPFPIIMLPIVKQTTAMGLHNAAGLILLYIVYGLSFNIFVYIGYLRSIPKDLEEAAIIDGANVWGIFWRVIFPLLAPMNATVGILTCLWAWNDFMLPLILLNDPDEMTLPLVQYIFKGQFSTDYNLAFASYLMALLPMIIVYVLAQKWIINGITTGAVK